MKDKIISWAGFLSGLVVLYLIPFLLDQLATGRVFLAWPQGSLWSNMIASFWWLLIAGWCTWYLRDHIGKKLAAFWSQHHPQKAALESLKTELAEVKARAIAAHHIANDTYKAVNGGQDHPMAPGKTPVTTITTAVQQEP